MSSWLTIPKSNAWKVGIPQLALQDDPLWKTFLCQNFPTYTIQGWLIAIFIDDLRQRFHFMSIVGQRRVTRSQSNERYYNMVGMHIKEIWIYMILKFWSCRPILHHGAVWLNQFTCAGWNGVFSQVSHCRTFLSRYKIKVAVAQFTTSILETCSQGIYDAIEWIRWHIVHCWPRVWLMTVTFCCGCATESQLVGNGYPLLSCRIPVAVCVSRLH